MLYEPSTMKRFGITDNQIGNAKWHAYGGTPVVEVYERSQLRKARTVVCRKKCWRPEATKLHRKDWELQRLLAEFTLNKPIRAAVI